MLEKLNYAVAQHLGNSGSAVVAAAAVVGVSNLSYTSNL